MEAGPAIHAAGLWLGHRKGSVADLAAGGAWWEDFLAGRYGPAACPRWLPMKIDSLFSVAGKVVVVTGGSRGIGEMIAAGFVANGAKVYISSRKAAGCDATAARLAETYGGTCISVPSDLSTMDGIDALAAALREREEGIDVLVNNAGVSWGAPLESFPEAGWDKVMDTNVKGVFFLTQRLLPMLEARATAENPARVVNIGSIDGIKSLRSHVLYGPSKARCTVDRTCATAAKRLVNAIAPGPFRLDAEHRSWWWRRCENTIGTPSPKATHAAGLAHLKISPGWRSSSAHAGARGKITAVGGILVS